MKRFFLLLASCLLFALPAAAQTTTVSAAFDTTDTPAAVAADLATFQVDTAAAIAVTPSCTAGTPTVCTFTVPGFDTTKAHALKVTLSNAAGAVSGTGSYTPPASPAALTGLKVVVTITFP